MNEMVYRNSKRYFVLAIYLVIVIAGLIANMIRIPGAAKPNPTVINATGQRAVRFIDCLP